MQEEILVCIVVKIGHKQLKRTGKLCVCAGVTREARVWRRVVGVLCATTSNTQCRSAKGFWDIARKITSELTELCSSVQLDVISTRYGDHVDVSVSIHECEFDVAIVCCFSKGYGWCHSKVCERACNIG